MRSCPSTTKRGYNTPRVVGVVPRVVGVVPRVLDVFGLERVHEQPVHRNTTKEVHNVFLVGWPERTCLWTTIANEGVFGSLVRVCLKCTTACNVFSDGAGQTRTPLQQNCPAKCLRIPSLGTCAIDKAKQFALLVWRAKRAYPLGT